MITDTIRPTSGSVPIDGYIIVGISVVGGSRGVTCH